MSGSSGSAGARVVDALSTLGSGLDELAGIDLHSVASAELPAIIEQLTVLQRRVDAQVLATVERFDASGAWKADGAASAQAWMRANLLHTPGSARASVRVARRLRDLPRMAEALGAGEISREHVQVVAGAMSRNPSRRETIAAAEPVFCDAARRMDPHQLARVVTRWTHAVDPLGALDHERELHAQRHLSVSRTFEGAVRIDGLLGPEQGACVMTALEAISTRDYRETRLETGDEHAADDRTAGQRRADALVELARGFLDSGVAPEIAGARPHLTLTVPAESLSAPRHEAGREPAELEGVGPISAEAARRVGCDSLLAATGLDDAGVPVTYGRTIRTVDPRLRKMLNVRDAGCRFPGCDRPPAWTQAHHIVHWAHGGPTDLHNLVLVCMFHHHACHEGGFTIRGSPQDRTMTFHRPDGSVLVDRRRDSLAPSSAR